MKDFFKERSTQNSSNGNIQDKWLLLLVHCLVFWQNIKSADVHDIPIGYVMKKTFKHVYTVYFVYI